MSAIPSFGSFSSHRAERPLTDEEMRAKAPSVFAQGKHWRRSRRYTYIPTAEVLTALRREGFSPFSVSQAKPRDPDRSGYTKHLIRFRHESRILGEEVPEIVLLNSHDGTSSYHMLAGLYRLVCANGLIVGDTALEVRVPHRGDIVGRVIEGAFQVLETFETVLAVRDEFRAIALDREKRLAFARTALAVRWPDRPSPVTPEQVLSMRRPQDAGSSLWTTLNIVQENLIRGGLEYRDTRGKWRRTRPITGIDGTVALNRALWSLAEEMARVEVSGVQ